MKLDLSLQISYNKEILLFTQCSIGIITSPEGKTQLKLVHTIMRFNKRVYFTLTVSVHGQIYIILSYVTTSWLYSGPSLT